ncbi:MAG: 7-carboxy-7-deazaguanine synthase QueE [Endomicrobia bacterium]|nr:7-carboxy-7-deazaguanine synthase QueE [Endomicrobiia bacterium]MCL2799525.1 7-carboxy-7-deazaguanine synthase QueE [Endomicrobiia bacterium]
MRSEELKATTITAPIYEVFFSYQGEGLYTGLPQIFVRLAGCNIKCGYCDTAYSLKVSDKAKYYTLKQLLHKIEQIYVKNKKYFFDKPSVSITGGEPLIYADFLAAMLPELRKKRFGIYLETNGTFPDNLKKVMGFCDIISADFKFASECGKSFWKEHKKFLEISVKKDVFVKCVITNKTLLGEIKNSAKVIKSVSKNIPVILQPSIDKNIPHIKNLYLFRSELKKILANVYVMPQMHKILNYK